MTNETHNFAEFLIFASLFIIYGSIVLYLIYRFVEDSDLGAFMMVALLVLPFLGLGIYLL